MWTSRNVHFNRVSQRDYNNGNTIHYVKWKNFHYNKRSTIQKDHYNESWLKYRPYTKTSGNLRTFHPESSRVKWLRAKKFLWFPLKAVYLRPWKFNRGFFFTFPSVPAPGHKGRPRVGHFSLQSAPPVRKREPAVAGRGQLTPSVGYCTRLLWTVKYNITHPATARGGLVDRAYGCGPWWYSG